jgi:hypothetical protein
MLPRTFTSRYVIGIGYTDDVEQFFEIIVRMVWKSEG